MCNQAYGTFELLEGNKNMLDLIGGLIASVVRAEQNKRKQKNNRMYSLKIFVLFCFGLEKHQQVRQEGKGRYRQ